MLVRTQNETDRATHTHSLETVDGGACQDTKRNRPSEAHSRPGEGRGRDLSGHRKKLTKRGELTIWGQQREELVRTQKEADRVRHTHFLETTEGLVRTRKETDRATPTHQLEMAEGETCQDTKINRLSDVHSLPRDDRGRNLSEHGKKLAKRGILTSCRWWRE